MCQGRSTGVRAFVTSSSEYAARLNPLLVRRDYRPIHAPTVQVKPLVMDKDLYALDDAILRLSDVDVVAFTSRNGVKAFEERLVALADGNKEAALLMLNASGVQFAALGQDATALKEHLGRTVDIVPLEASPQDLVRFMEADLQRHGQRVLCPVPKVVNMREPDVVPQFLEALARKFVPVRVNAYVTAPTHRVDVDIEIELLLRGCVKYAVFTSSAEALALAAMLTDEELEALQSMVQQQTVVLVAHGPYTASGVQDALGVEHVEVSRDFSSFQGIVHLIEDLERQEARRSEKLSLA